MWAAEPHLEARKRIGFQVMIFLLVFAGLLYFTKKKVWAERALTGRPHDLQGPAQGLDAGPLRLYMRRADGATAT